MTLCSNLTTIAKPNSGDLTPRIVYSILVEVVVFIVTVVMAMMDSSYWPGEFFWITMSLVVVLNSMFSAYSFLQLLFRTSDTNKPTIHPQF